MDDNDEVSGLLWEVRNLTWGVIDAVDEIDVESLPNFSNSVEARNVEKALRESAAIIGALAKVVASPTRSNFQKFLEVRGYRPECREVLLEGFEKRCAARDAISPTPTESEVDTAIARHRQVVTAAYFHERCDVGVAYVAEVMACSRSTVYSRLEQFAKWPAVLQEASLDRVQCGAVSLALGGDSAAAG